MAILLTALLGMTLAPAAARGAGQIEITLVPSITLGDPNDPITLTATVTEGGIPVTTGLVRFQSQADPDSHDVDVDSNGVATYDDELRAGYTSWEARYYPGGTGATTSAWGRTDTTTTLELPATMKQGRLALARMRVGPLPPDHGIPALTLFDETTGTTVGPSLPTPYDDEVWVDLAVLAPGPHVLHAVFTGDDHVHDSVSPPATITVTPDDELDATIVNSSSKLYPHKDGYKDTVKTTVRSSEPVTIAFSVLNAAGTTVRSSHPAPVTAWTDTKTAFTWNGTSNTGKRVPAGKYRIRAVVTDGFGHMLTKTFAVAVSAKRLVWHTVSSSPLKAGRSWSGRGSSGTGSARAGGTWSTGGRLRAGDGWVTVAYTLKLRSTSVPKSAVVRKITAYVAGKGPSGTPDAEIGIHNTAYGSWKIINYYDAIKKVGKASKTYSTSTTDASHHRSGKTVHVIIIVNGGTWDVRRVKVTYRYAVLK
jgi:flagellar hook capping protein FlgD